MKQQGKLWGVGTGPGDPELLTLKAARIIASADVVAFFSKKGSRGNGFQIVENHIPPQAILLPLTYPVTVEKHHKSDEYAAEIAAFYQQSADAIAEHLDAGRVVAVLSEGDPLLYGSYMHLHVRLAPHYPTEVVAGVTAMSGCWSMAGMPLVQGDEILSILPGTLGEHELTERLRRTDGAVIMKVGRNLGKIRTALANVGKLETAIYVERGTMTNGRVLRLNQLVSDVAPYFSIILVPGWESRPHGHREIQQ